jgi:nitroimidazol reductase NimA-like FMN-containing flavoprotein (pyridoxamine 5'-phosphate oxidase superfamily)
MEARMTSPIITGKMNKEAIDAALQAPHLARLATADPATLQPHVVPVWYGWDGESVWISSYSSTRKIRELKSSPYCSIVVDAAEGVEGVSAVLFEGKAELVTTRRDFLREKITWVYARYLGPEGVLAPDPQRWLDSPENLLIKLTPERIIAW